MLEQTNFKLIYSLLSAVNFNCLSNFAHFKRHFPEINTSCPKSYSDKIWWNQIELGSTRVEDCPKGTVGVAKRYCHRRRGWFKPDLSACMSLEFIAANRTVSQQLDQVYRCLSCLSPRFYTRPLVHIRNVLTSHN